MRHPFRIHRSLGIVLVLCLVSPSIAAAASSAKFAGTAADIDYAGGTFSWSDLTGVTADGGQVASTQAISGFGSGIPAITEYLNATNFGFTIPDSATIDGVSVTLNRGSCMTQVTDAVIQLTTTSSTPVGENKADMVTTWGQLASSTVSYGGATDTWGLALTPSIINNTSFGIIIAASNLSAGICAFDFSNFLQPTVIDYISMTVHYTEAAAETSSGGGGNATWLIQLRQQNGLNPQGNPLSSSSSSSSASSVSIEVPVETVTVTDTTEGTASSASSSSSSVSTAQAVEWHWFSDTDQTPEPWVASFRLRVCDRIEGWFKTKPSSVLASVLPRLNDRLKSRWGFGCRAPTSEGI
ncbi:MAG: hypothetical protein KBA40_03355 [Candidatus Peribacteraceae bacterium]|nr:hypothetical protein [Candidatus Peribacteraceae bacterium]